MTTFADLPEVPGFPGHRYVNNLPMTEECFVAEGWHTTGSYEVDHPTNGHRTVHYWACDPEGVRRYAELRRQRRQERKTAWQARQETDDSWSSHVASLIEGDSE